MMESANKVQQEEFLLKVTRPIISATSKFSGYKVMNTNHLVEQMDYIFIHVVEAKNLPKIEASCNPYVEVKLGEYKATTRHIQNDINPKWDQVFAFLKNQVQSSIAEVVIKDKSATGAEDFIAKLLPFDLNQIPRCQRQNHLAPEWYKLVTREGEDATGELLLAIWMGTQADKYFPQAWQSDAATVAGEYILPRLWYVRVNVIETQDLVHRDRTSIPKVRVLAVLGTQNLTTRTQMSCNPMWNEDLLFVAAEPFAEKLVLIVEDVGGLGRTEILGKCVISLQVVDRRLDHKPMLSRWYSLSRTAVADEYGSRGRYYGRIHLRICLEGGYHVLSERTDYCTDVKPAGKQLWRVATGLLELGVIGAHGLKPKNRKDNGGKTNAYCVAKYGSKWVRTRTITNNNNPKWNEQYQWEVYDPFTVITIAVFDDHHFDDQQGANVSSMGKVRIRVSSLESGRHYRHRYPLLVLHPSGIKKLGEIELVVQFTCTSWINMLQLCSRPMLPKMHYIHPLSVWQISILRDVAIEIISNRFDKTEPPLRNEVVYYLLDLESTTWSWRKSKANFNRVMNILIWFDQICKWERPYMTIYIHFLLTTLLFFPEILPSTIFFSLFLIGIWNYRHRRAFHLPHVDSHLSLGDIDDADELEEEFDTFPTSQPSYTVKMRYDRLRREGSRIQAEMEKWAALGERFQSLVSWSDPRATAIFLPFCILTCVVFYYIELKTIVGVLGFYLLRHPWLRMFRVHQVAVNFFTRLPTNVDSTL